MIRANEEKRELVEKLQEATKANDEPADGIAIDDKTDDAKMSDLLHRVFIVMETSDEITAI